MKEKRLLVSLLAILLCCVLLVSCTGQKTTLTGISVAGADGKTFEVGHELTLADLADLTVSVEYSDEKQNKTLSLKDVTALPEGLTVDMIGKKVVEGNNTVTVTYRDGDVSKSVTFTVKGVSSETPEYKVTYPTVGITVNGPTTVKQGADLSFTVIVKDGYRITDEGLRVFANGKEVNAAGGNYNVVNIQADVVITVTGVEPVQTSDEIEVYAPDVEGVIFTGADKAEIGSDYVFTISLEPGYTKTQDFCVKVNGKVLTENANGEYVVENVTGEFTITVTGVEMNALNVRFEGVGFIPPEVLTVRFGGNYSFSILADPNYSDSESQMKVYRVDGDTKTELTPINGTYVIENVTADLTILVEGLLPNTYTVTPPEAMGVLFEGADSVVVGETYSFRISFRDGYIPGPGFAVYAMCGGEKVTATQNVETGDYEFVVSGIPAIFVEGVYRNAADVPMAQWPDDNSVQLTEIEEVPDGYLKAYTFTMGWQWGYRTNLASLDITKYSAISFKIRALDLVDPACFHLYQGETFLMNFFYEDTSWHEIVLTKNSAGAWIMTVDGEVLEGFSSTATNLKDVFNFSLGNTAEGCPDSHFQVTSINGVPLPAAMKDGYEEVIDIPMAQWPDDNSVEVVESAEVPDGYLKAYAFTMGWQWGFHTNLANVDISKYTKVSFMIRATDLQNPALFHLYQGDTYLKNFYYADTSWHEIVLTKNSDGAWTLTVDGAKIDGFISTETNLKDVINFSLGNATEGCPDSHFQVTHIIGVKDPSAPDDPIIPEEPVLTDISVSGADGLTFEIGHELTLQDLADLTVLLTYSDATKNITISLTDLTALPEGLTIDLLGKTIAGGENTVTVTYRDGDVTKQTTFTVVGTAPEVPTYSVTYPTQGVTADGPVSVTGGETLRFTVTVKNGYRETADGLKVFVNGTEVSATDGTYVVKNVQADLVITVTGVEPIPGNAAVIAPVTEGVVFTGKTTVEIGQNYTFTITLKSGYRKTGGFAVKVNGTTVTENANGEYVVENVQTHLTITVTGVEAIPGNAAVIAPATEGIVFTGKATVEIGQNYTFTITLKSGYRKTSGFAVKVNGAIVTENANGEYVVENVQTHLTITVTGVEAIPATAAVTAPNTDGIVFVGETSVNLGQNYTFKITLQSGYHKTGSFAVKVNGTTVTGNASGEYVVENVQSDLVITVTGVQRETSLADGYQVIIDVPMAQWPDSNSVEVTACDDLPDGYLKAYAFKMGYQWGYRTNLANVDISKYTTVSFKIRALDLQNPALFHLYQGDTYLKNFYYEDTSWHEIVLTKNASGAWIMTVDGEVVEGFTSTETNLKDVFNFSLGNTTEGCPDSHFQVTQIIGIPLPPALKDGYQEVISIPMAQWPDSNSVEVTVCDEVPDGYLKAYAFTMGWQWGYRTNLANVDISKYTTVSFMIRTLDLQNPGLFHLYQGDTYLKNFYYADTSWHEIVLTKNASGAWIMTIDGEVLEGFTSTETNLKDVINFSLGNSTQGCPDSHFQVTQIIGIPMPSAIKDGYEEIISIPMAQWPDDNSVEVTDCDEVPDGYLKAYAFTMGYQWGYRTNLANVDISDYTTVSFQIRALDLQNPGLFHLYQGDTYLKNFYYADTSWHEIVLTKNASGVWTMTVDGTAVDSFTSTATNLKDLFNFSLGNATEGSPESHFQVTHIIGVRSQNP